MGGSDGCRGLGSGNGAAPLPPCPLPREAKRHTARTRGKLLAPGLVGCKGTMQPDSKTLNFLTADLKLLKKHRQPAAFFAACCCSTELWPITHRLFWCLGNWKWLEEIPRAWHFLMKVHILPCGSRVVLCWWEELKRSEKEKSSISFLLISLSVFGQAAFAHGKCFDRLLLGFFPQVLSQVWEKLSIFYYSTSSACCAGIREICK